MESNKLFNNHESKVKIKNTDVENIMNEKNIIHNDKYPTQYWKIIASIYFMIKGKLPSVTFEKKSIYDLYLNFNSINRPFRNNTIDTALKNLGYDLNIIQSTKDKMIILVKYYSNDYNECETELCENLNFLNYINFLSFYETLINFKLEKKESICRKLINFSVLERESQVFKSEKKKINNSSGNFIFNSLLKRLKHNISTSGKIKILISKFLSGDFNIRIEDLNLVILFCKQIFGKKSENYIKDLLIVLKIKKIPIGIIILVDSELALEYHSIENSLEYVVKNSKNIDLNTVINYFSLTKENYANIISKCNSEDKFHFMFFYSKELHDERIEEAIGKFIIGIVSNGGNFISNLREYHHDIINLMENLKYEILVAHIKNLNIKGIETSMKHAKNYDFENSSIVEAVGRSSSVPIFKLIYPRDKRFSIEFAKSLVLSNLSVGSEVFYNMSPVIRGYISNHEIVNSLVDSQNSNLLQKYKNDIKSDTIEKSVAIGNIVTFNYIWNMELSFDIDKLVEIAIKNQREKILSVLLTKYNADIVKLILKNWQYMNISILDILFKKMNLDFNDPKVQLLKLGNVIVKILESDFRDWFLDNVKVVDFFNLALREEDLFYDYSDDELEYFSTY